MPIATIKLPDGRTAKMRVPEGATQDEIIQFASQNAQQFEKKEVNPDANIFYDYGKKSISALLEIAPGFGEAVSGLTQRVAEVMDREDISAAIGKRVAEERAKLTPEQRLGRGVAKAGLGFLVPGATIPRIAGASAALSALEPTESGTRGDAVRQVAVGTATGLATAGAFKLAGGTISKIRKSLKPKPDASADAFRSLASQAYKEAEEKGGIFKGTVMNKLLKEVDNLKPKSRIAKTLQSNSPIRKVSNDLEKFRNESVNLDDLQAIDEYFSEVIDGATELGRVKKVGLPITKLQNKLRGILDNIGKDDVIGGTEGLEALKRGRNLWSRASKLRDVESIINRAKMSPNEATAIKTGFRTLASNPNRLRGFTTTEKELVVKAAKSGVVGDTLRTLGSRLLPIGTAVSGGGVGATLATKAATDISRSAAARVQAGKASKVEREIVESVFPEIYKLKPILRKKVVDNLIRTGSYLGAQKAIQQD